MAKKSPEARLLCRWFAARKADRKSENRPFTLADGAAELTEMRQATVYPHQLCVWMKHGRMSPTTRAFIRSALAERAATQAV